MLYDSVEVKAIMIALGNTKSIGIESKEILLKSIVLLREYYEQFLELSFLKKAVWHIYAYLELGFPYEEVEKEMQVIANYLGSNIEDIFPKRKWKYKSVKLAKSSVRNLLGRWSPKCHSMKIADVVDDIIKNTEEKKIGEYTYYSGKVIRQDGEKTLWEQTYKLYVYSEEAVLYDVNRNKYYMLG